MQNSVLRVIKAYLNKLSYQFSSVQCNFPDEIAKRIIEWGKKNIPDEDIHIDPNDSSSGREDHIHVTVKYGIHTTDPKVIKNLIKDQKSFGITLGKTSIFPAKETGGEYDVLKIDVVDSPELMNLNKIISDNVEVTDTHPSYKPHVTAGYLKKGTASKYAGSTEFGGMKVKFDSVEFSGSDDKKTIIHLKSENPKIISVDFDGTIVVNNFDVTKTEFTLLPHAKEVLDWMYKNFYIIIWTVRTGPLLDIALKFLDSQKIKYHNVNDNAPFFNHDTSRKIYWDYCIDDLCSKTPINWLEEKKFLSKKFDIL